VILSFSFLGILWSLFLDSCQSSSEVFQCEVSLLGLEKSLPWSFIAQNFPITKSQILAFFSFVESRHSTTWWNAVIDSINFDEASGFSEYETLGTFVKSISSEPLRFQSGSWSRRGSHYDVLRKIQNGNPGKLGHDFVAIEDWMQGTPSRSRLRNVGQIIEFLAWKIRR
jgi:hypothetical protein